MNAQLPVEGQGVPHSRDAWRPRLTSPINGQGLPRQGRARLKKQVQEIRIGTLNVGSMTGRSREVVDVMERRKVDIFYVCRKQDGEAIKQRTLAVDISCER